MRIYNQCAMNLNTESRNTICTRTMFSFRCIIVNTLHKYNNSYNNSNNDIFNVLIYLFVIDLQAHPVIRTACRRVLEQLVKRTWKKEAGVLFRCLPKRTEEISENLNEGSWCSGRGLHRVHLQYISELL